MLSEFPDGELELAWMLAGGVTNLGQGGKERGRRGGEGGGNRGPGPSKETGGATCTPRRTEDGRFVKV